MSTAQQNMNALKKALKEYRQVDDYRILRAYLGHRPKTFNTVDWTTAKEITAETGLTAKRVRDLCQVYPLGIVSSGYGYKLTHLATRQERVECVQSLLQRAEKITARAAALSGSLG